jgi:hypothetical protein
MSENNFEEYKTFTNHTEIKEFTNLMDQNHIEYNVHKITPVLDPAFAGNTQNDNIVIKIKPSDVERVEQILLNEVDVNVEDLAPDYYLLYFTDDELMDVVVKKDEWNDFDYVLAQKLLKERGKEITPDVLEMIRRQRISELSKQNPYPGLWIIAGYVFSVLGGLIGVFIGLMLIWDTKKLPGGTKIYAYDSKARRHGKMILVVALIMLILTIIFDKLEEFDIIFNR